GRLQQRPAPQLAKLRGEHIVRRNVLCDDGDQVFTLPPSNTLEIGVEMDVQSAKGVQLGIHGGGKDPVTVSYNGSELVVQGAKAPLGMGDGERSLKLRIFVDRSVLEVFANDVVCLTKTIAPLENNLAMNVHAVGGKLKVKQVDAWTLKPVW